MTPGGKVGVTPILAKGEPPRLDFRDTGEPGPYEMRYSVRGASAIDAGTRERSERFVVNVNGREGDIRRIGRAELENRYVGVQLNYARTFSGRIDAEAQLAEGEIWKGLLYALLALLFIEVFLARRFGDSSRRLSNTQVTS